MTRVTATRALMPLLALLLLLVAGCRNPIESREHRRAVGVVITDLQDQEIARLEGGQWQGSPLTLQVGAERPVQIYFLNLAGERFHLPHTGAPHTLRVVVANPDVASYQAQGEHGIFRGETEGATTANIMVWHGNHSDYESNPHLPITVTP